jgi:S-formylglutathione hydrolase
MAEIVAKRMGRGTATALAWMTISAANVIAQEGRIEEVRLRSPALEASRLGGSAERSILVYVPASYDVTPGRSYPVVYLLHSYGAGPASWLGEDGYEGMDIRVVLDSLTRTSAIEDMLVVMPDAQTPLGGSWYVNSPVSGFWEDFVAHDLVSEIDRRYRTIPHRHARGIAGQSMGGYGAAWIALQRPEVFSAVSAMSPVNVERPNPFGTAGGEAALTADPRALDRAPTLARLLWSKAVAFSPEPDRAAPHAVLPYRIAGDSVERVEAVWERWRQRTLQRAVEVRGATLRDVAVQLEVGEEDPVAPEVARLSAALDRAGVQHTYSVFEGGHVAGVRARFEGSVFQFFSAHFAGVLSNEREVSFRNGSVELRGTLLVPDGEGPMPAIVFLHGSGPQTRGGFRTYAVEFARLGIASLYFDKRGSGESGGSWVNSSMEDLVGTRWPRSNTSSPSKKWIGTASASGE